MDTSKRVVVQPGDGYIKPGVADLSPEAGYIAATPYQYADENDTMFKQRVAMWESAKASASQIAQGGATVDQQKAAAKARYEAEIANIDAVAALEAKAAGKPVAKPAPVVAKPVAAKV